MVKQHLEVQEPTVLGHMIARRLGTQSSKKKGTAGIKEMEDILAEENDPLQKPVPGVLQH